MTKISTITVCDLLYIDHFEAFINSYILYENNKNMNHNHFYIYENIDEITEFKLKFWYIPKYINIYFIKYSQSANTKINKRIFSCHYKFTAVLQILNKYDFVFFLDVDSLINKSLYEKLNSINHIFSVFLRVNLKSNKFVNKTNTELGDKFIDSISNIKLNPKTLILQKNLLKYPSFVMGGAFLCKNTDASYNILYDINKNIEILYDLVDNPNEIWGCDQISLSKVFKENIGKIPIHVFDTSLFDFYLKSSSYVFMSKGVTFPTERKAWKNIIHENKNTINSCFLILIIIHLFFK